ncbi:unnamed protein product [Haemonchus placei]|uniref:MLVIN_C domain-containing protein n=1 Tax=Haemonchus placei TaxID=6290 RepID=A0A0N4W6I1_HAEPC|nr:unnamed protein product [Haemonchus placei]
MKMTHDRDKRRCSKLPKIGDKVYMNVSHEKQLFQNPKLVNPWEGPYRVLDTSESSALVRWVDGGRWEGRDPVHDFWHAGKVASRSLERAP